MELSIWSGISPEELSAGRWAGMDNFAGRVSLVDLTPLKSVFSKEVARSTFNCEADLGWLSLWGIPILIIARSGTKAAKATAMRTKTLKRGDFSFCIWDRSTEPRFR
jgi:hypothetical protein